MSTNDSNDRDTTGYFLPEDTQLRLKKLHEYVTFLANLARPRQADEGAEWTAEIRPGEVAICLEQLEAQIAQVMEELSWPAERGTKAAASEADAETGAHEDEDDDVSDTDAEAPDAESAPAKRYSFGVTLDQIDEMNLLLGSLRALGNVVTCADHAEFAKATLSIMGDAIYRDVDKLRDIVDDIYESQQLEPRRQRHTVREAPVSYLVLPEHSPTRSASPQACELPIYH